MFLNWRNTLVLREALFNPGGNVGSPPPAPTAPNRADAAALAASEAERMGLIRRQNGVGRKQTILSSSQGDMTPATVQRATLLGGT